MIAHLQGKLLTKEPSEVVIDAGGVGYHVLIPLSTYYDLGQPGNTISLHIHTHLRDGAIELFGFGTAGERALFKRLIAISNVGPRTALAVLSGIEPPELLAAVAEGQFARIALVPGIGKKTAERLVLELRDKLPELQVELGAPAHAAQGPGAMRDDLVSALVNLGYKQRDADSAVRRALEESAGEPDFNHLLRRALNQLTRI